MTKVKKYVTETLGAEVLVRSTNQPQTSYAVSSSLLELELKKILMDKIEENNSIDRSNVQKNLYRALLEAYNSDKDLLSLYGEVVTLKTEDVLTQTKLENLRWIKLWGRRSDKDQEGRVIKRELKRIVNVYKFFQRSATDVDERLWNPSGSRTPDREWNQTKTVDDRPPQQWMTKLA
ncbi:hypothetical protein Tco_0808018 [Tanacetum coccineum]